MARVEARTGRAARTVSVLSALIAPLVHAPPARSDLGPASTSLVADDDDDDLDGVPDGSEALLSGLSRVDLVRADEPAGATLVPTRGADHVRLVSAGRPLAWGAPLSVGAALQGLSPGVVELTVHDANGTRSRTLSVMRVGFHDGQGRTVDLTRSHASLEREPPSEVTPGETAKYDDPDALRLFVITPDASAPAISVESTTATGGHLDALAAPLLSGVPCDTADRGSSEDDLHCFASDPLRFVIDDVDRRHPLAVSRSIRAELGGAIVLRRGGKKLQAIRVLGPRDSPVGPIGRLRATLRPIVMRASVGGSPSIGGSEAGAMLALRAELSNAAAVWGECGVSFGPVSAIPVRVLDPPPAHLLAFGDDLGLPASGGRVEVKVGRGVVSVESRAGESPEEVAHDAARAFERAGYVALVSPNARVASGAYHSADLLVRRHDGTLVSLESLHGDGVVSHDASLSVRIGSVDLSDGLTHFGDVDSVAGTLEERTLLKALDDGDPRTIEVVVIPYFAGVGRIGESFIGSDRSSLRNIVLFDRAGVRARRSSLTLAHELGHVLLDVPGHPDDYGVDTPTRLMDADASDASPFGPRRLTLAECARVVRESGPDARSPLLGDWPLTPLTYPPLTEH
jgi:hypothetical protein